MRLVIIYKLEGENPNVTDAITYLVLHIFEISRLLFLKYT